jgi:hypothetical protein
MGAVKTLETSRATDYRGEHSRFVAHLDPTLMTPFSMRLAIAAAFTFASALSPSYGVEIEVTIDAGKHDRSNEVVRVPVELPKSLDILDAVVTGGNGVVARAQLSSRPLTARPVEQRAGYTPYMLDLLVTSLKAGEQVKCKVTTKIGDSGFPKHHWREAVGQYTDLRFDGSRRVLRYMYEPIDNSSKARREETYKPYHHLFDPRGERLVTKGPGGLFPHHRGLFFGFNKITYGDNQQADTWHCNRGEWQAHKEILDQDAGPLLGTHRVAIDWHGRDGKVFVKEQRELTAYNLPGGTLVEFASKLTSTAGKVHLDGDPQHAGFQFRASQEVPDKTAKQTYYLRPDGKDKPGSFRNWPQRKGHENLPWNALSFVLGKQRYTAVYLDHPKNPKPARYSERDYGRFGSYFAADVEPDKPLTVNYRLWLQEGEMTVEQANALSRQFAEPATATVVGK